MPRTTAVVVLGAALAAAGAPAGAHDQGPRYDQVHLSASAGREVDTDTLVAVLYKEHQSTDQATAADEVNRDVAWAVDLARARHVTVQTDSYRTRPVYQKQHIQGWRVYQSIRLESRDSGTLAALLGDLQQRLSIQSLHNVLSPESRRQAEDDLIAQALAAFESRAGLVASTLGRPSHRIVDLSIDAGGDRTPPPMARRAAMAAASTTAVAPPAIEGGSMRVEVRVSGTVELAPAAL